MESFKAMSRKERRELSVRAGILDDAGRLTKQYGGEADPSDKYEPIDIEA